MIKKFNEHRQHSRVNVQVKALFSGQFGFDEKIANNISKGGIYVETDDFIGKIGDKQELIIITPDDIIEVAVLAQLVRYCYNNEQQITGAGFKFILVEPAQQSELNSFIDGLLTQREIIGKREHVRITARFPLKFPALDELRHAYTENISRGGLFFYSPRQLEKIQEFNLMLQNPLSGENLLLKAKIVSNRRIERKKAPAIFGIGVKFIEVEKNVEDKLALFIRDWVLR